GRRALGRDQLGDLTSSTPSPAGPSRGARGAGVTSVAKSTDRSRASSDAVYREAFAMVTDAILIANETGRCVDANQAATALLRYDRVGVLSRSIPDLIA